LFIAENTIGQQFIQHPGGESSVIALIQPQQYQQTGLDRAYDFTIDLDASIADTLDQGFHR
jgi:hypothetical protein